jgi:hypothetical protein
MRRLAAVLLALSWSGCGPSSRDDNNNNGEVDAPDVVPCVGLECQVVDCAKDGLPATSISGTVFAPNGTLALYGATVYVPRIDPGPFPDGVECAKCTNDALPGEPIVQVLSDEAGRFTLSGVPAGNGVTLFVTIGKWRRKVVLPTLQACTDNPLAADLTRLPKNRTEGDIPRIAVVTGSCDALECLIRKLGVSDSEFTNEAGDGRIHLYASNGANRLANNAMFAPASQLWGDLEQLKRYDIAMHSCECSTRVNEKSMAMLQNMKAYADLGGRVFLSHYHNVWVAGDSANPAHAIPEWAPIASCRSDGFANGNDFIDQVNNPKGGAFATWMMNVMGSPTQGVIPIQSGTGRQTCTSVDLAKAERWVFFPSGGNEFPQNFQFSTPNEAPKEQRCGKVVFSDMHVANGSSSSSGTPFPNGCSSAELSPQEKALAFMFFDIATCVGEIF